MFLIVEVFDYVRLLNCSITERSIAFAWQNFFVSSIKFDYRTQSSDWVRLGSITELSIDYAGPLFVSGIPRFSVLHLIVLLGEFPSWEILTQCFVVKN